MGSSASLPVLEHDMNFLTGALSRSKTHGAETSRKGDMLCEGCCTKFPFYKRKRQCGECHLTYCSNCLIPPGSGNVANATSASSVLSRMIEKNQLHCRKCRVLLARPLCRADLRKLRVKDLQHYLTTHHVSFKGCVEKEDLVNVLIRYVGSTGSYNDVRQSGSGGAASNSPDESQSSGYYTNRRSSVPNLPSPTDQPPTNVSTPSSEAAPPQPAVDVEELTDWEDLGAEALELGPEPMISEIEDEIPLPADPEGGQVLIDELPEELPPSESEENPSSATESPLIPKALVISAIKTLDDLEQLSIKQLKELLVRNRVDFRGCVEKAELVERVTRLWNESVQARKELDDLTMDELCKVCMDAPVECVMLECGHMATCTACGKQLNECPICRQYVVRVVRIFKA